MTIHNIVDNNLTKLAVEGTQKYVSEMGKEIDIFDQINEMLGKKEAEESETPEPPKEPEPPIKLPANIKIVETGTDKNIKDYFENKEQKITYNGREITNVNQLTSDKYRFTYNKQKNEMQVKTDITEIQDSSGKGHTLNLKNGTAVKRDLDGNYYLDFDGEDDYAQINTLEASIDWQNGFTIEFEAMWKDFYYWSRLLDFGNGIDRDNILVLNNKYNNILNFSIYDGDYGEEFEKAIITQNQKAKFKIQYIKIGTDRYRVYIYKNGQQYLSQVTELKVNNILRTKNYIGFSSDTDSWHFNGRLYSLKITEANGTEILHYDLNEEFNTGLELYVIGAGYNDDLFDLSEKNHTLYLKNGAIVKKDQDGDYYIEFDGRDDYGQIDELEASIDWYNGFEIEFVAEWHKFANYSRILDFSNGADSDNIMIGNIGEENSIFFGALYGNGWASEEGGNPTLVLNERVKYKIKYGKNSSNKLEAVITKNGKEIFKQNGTRTLKNILRTINYLGRSAYDGDAYFSGKIYSLKITQTNGTEILNYDINELLNKKIENVKIANINDWNAFVNKANAGATYYGRKVSIDTDLNLDNVKQTPMSAFEGVLDGDNHKIQGININSSGEASGLFRYNSGIIQNLNIENINVSRSGYSKTGGIAGVNTGTINNVNISGTVSGYDMTGGICGDGIYGSQVLNCTNTANVTGRDSVRWNNWRRRK